ncbi:FecR family protein [Fulvivirga ulvae]|uniref:FecR family protein n=1 Tax=Fulvivirga ulvae TaxID=2904245 RepID=UPI001F30E224|nr:FecR family protein [Fulvivirga ulvae]UII29625.1 FecR family protein [Fulvivirga ulvae]
MNRLKVVLVFVVPALILGACAGHSIETDDNFEVVELPDGSIVYLNHHSAVNYNKGFEARIVEVSGEAFFEVAKANIPFVVRTVHGEVKVLGTEFNVKTATDELEVEVEEGVVELKTSSEIQEVKKGQRAVWKKGRKAIEKRKGELKFKVWLNALEKEFRQLGREIKRGGKKVQKESEKVGKEINKGTKRLQKELKDL